MQSSDSLLGQGVDGGLLSAPKGQQEAREEEEEDSAEVSADRYSADSRFLPISRDVAAGSCSQTHKPLMLQRQQLQDSSCYCVLVCFSMRVHLCTHACVTHTFFFVRTKPSYNPVLSVLSFADPPLQGNGSVFLTQLSCQQSVSQLGGKTQSQAAMQFFP